MAKIALIFLLFALFAVAMSASVPSGEASNPVQDVANQIAKAFRENTTPEKIEELKEKFGEFWNAALESAKKISAETNQKIQEFENKAH